MATEGEPYVVAGQDTQQNHVGHDSPLHTPSRRHHHRPWWRRWWRSIEDDAKHLTTINYSPEEREKQIRKLVDDNGFNFKVFFVAASGFLASSYSLFATNVITPAISFVYPSCNRLNGQASQIIDLLTLIGTILGMLLMGHCADRAGRKKLYGLELLILIVATMGVVQASNGFVYQTRETYKPSMDIYAWLAWWRTALGFGIGAEYPLSAIITAEWASTESRGLMLASVKFMQSLARILAVAIGLRALRSTTAAWHASPADFTNEDGLAKLVVDRVWRWVIGIAVIPATVAIIARVTIPETPRYYVDIMKDLRKAVRNALQVYKGRRIRETNTSANAAPRSNDDQADRWFSGAWNYLKRDAYLGLRNLCLISLLWGLMDVGFYGLSLDSPSVLSTLSNTPANARPLEDQCTEESTWKPTSEPMNTNIYDVLEHNSIRSLEIVSIASVTGSFTAMLIINFFRRKMILFVTFLMLAVFFAVTGGVLISTYKDWRAPSDGIPTIVFYAITQFVYNAGPNTMIFVLAAEIFPTVYRGTFYGVAAATGKVGAIITRAIIQATGDGHKALGIRLLVFVPLMLIASLISWNLPDVQYLPTVADVETPTEPKSTTQGSEEADTARPNVVTTEPRTTRTTEVDTEEAEVGEDGNESISTEPDSSSTHTSDSDPTERIVGKRPAGFFSRLHNMPLEEIAPNPSLAGRRRRRSSAGVVQQTPAGGRLDVASTTTARPVASGALFERL
ncbi:major facilitator superfamily domain-containing protein [Thelonectria olida]|uniref:Major facilitator superfamily domain-containing protein n=1 Tax=Thelonectria olida TaxID=1576542 RepID=A0A9P9AJT5_9HYPO|nr:major facilitator superfamily domain-containing protein [Thelonectria olida]